MNTSAPPLSGSFAHTRSGLPPLSWPTPPFPSYAETPAPPEGWACRVEGSNGQVRPCVLVALDAAAHTAHIQVPPARTTIGCELNNIQVEIDCIAVLPSAG